MGPVAAVRDFVAAHMLFVNTVVTTDLILRLDRQSGAVEILEFLALGRRWACVTDLTVGHRP